LSGKPVTDDEGNVVAYRGTGRDITERKQAEAELSQAKKRAVTAEAELDEALEAMSEGFTYFDAEDRLIRCNSKQRELFPSHAEAMVPGARFEDLLRKQVQNIHLPWAADREEDWIAERVAQHRNPGEPVEQRFVGGRVIRLSEYKTRSGGIVSIRTDITELKRAEEEARDSRDRIRLIADNLPASVTYFDTEQRFRFVNRTAREWFARPLEDILGHTIREIIGPEIHDQLSANLEAALSGEKQRFEKNKVYPDGKPRVVETSYVPHFDDDGEVQGCFALNHDITERKCAEEALRESEARLAKAAEIAKVGYWIWDEIEDKAIYCSDELAKICGVATGRELTARLTSPEKDLELVHPADRGRFAEAVRRSKAERTGYDIECRIVRPDGEVRYLREILEPVLDEQGNFIRSNGIVQDVTARKHAEQAVRESQERFRDYAEASADWFWEMDADLRFTYMSENVERFIEVAPEWHYGKTREDLLGDDYDRDAWAEHLKALRERKPFRNFEYLRTGDGVEPVWLRASGVPVFAEDGAFLGYRGTGSDITEKKRVAAN